MIPSALDAADAARDAALVGEGKGRLKFFGKLASIFPLSVLEPLRHVSAVFISRTAVHVLHHPVETVPN
jgi:hypothetical protein